MDTWTTRKLLTWTTQHFEAKHIDSPRVAAEMLLAHVLDTQRLRLYMEPDRPASDHERDTFRALVARASKHEPVDYLVGHAPFFGLTLTVNAAVLIPRPSTETLVEYVLQNTRPRNPEPAPEALSEAPSETLPEISVESSPEVSQGPLDAESRTGASPENLSSKPTFSERGSTPSNHPGESNPPRELTYEPEAPPSQAPPQDPDAPSPTPETPASPKTPKREAKNFRGRIADVCTGSGAIVITLAKQLPHATFVATDLSEDALAVAQQNAEDHGVADRIDFRLGHLYEPLGDERFDFLLSNPPYISDAEWQEVPPNVKDHEPTLALRSGTDGLDHLRPLLAGAHRHLLPGGQALFEFSSTHATAVEQLAVAAEGLANPAILKDHENFPRILVVDAR